MDDCVTLNVFLDVDIAKLSGILPLLQTCTTSSSVDLDGRFSKKIEIHSLNSGPALSPIRFSMRGVPVHYEEREHGVRNYTYMRPSQDILMVNAESLIALHQYGGSLNLEGLAHIALHKATLWATGLWGIKVGRGHPDVQRRIDLLNFIKAQCSTLKSLSIVLYNETTYEDPTTNSRLLDLNNDLLKLDLRDRSGEQVPRRKVSPHYGELDRLLKEQNFIV